MTSQLDYTALLYSWLPPIFALLTLILSKSENRYFDARTAQLGAAHQLNAGMTAFVTRVAKSSKVIKNYITSTLSGLLSLLIALDKWPPKWRPGGSLVVVALLILFQRSMWTIFSLQLDQIYGDRVPRKKPKPGKPRFHNYTYAQFFTRLQILFNIALMLVILVGQLL